MAFNNIVNKIRTGVGAAGSAVNMVSGLLGEGEVGDQQKFNVGKLKSALSTNGGLLEPNMGLLRMTEPPCLRGDPRPSNFLCNSMNLPTRSLAVVDYKRYNYGVTDKRVEGGAFGDLVLSFFVSNDGEPVLFFNEWFDNIFYTDASKGAEAESPKGLQVFNIKYREEYVTQLEVLVHSKTQDEVFVYKFYEAFPTNIGDVQLEWSAQDQFAVIGIPFSYRFYTIDKIKPAEKTNGASILSEIKNGLGVVNRLVNSAPARNILQGLNVASAQKLF